MRTLLALTIVLAPLIARADDELGPYDPPAEAPPAEAPPAEAPYAQPPSETPYAQPPSDGPFAEPPPSEAPYAEAPPSAAPIVTPAPAAAPRDKHHCGTHSRWSHRRWSDSRKRGTLAVGLAKGHIGMGDDHGGSQESLFFRLQTRRGWGAELELARATIDDADKAKTVGGALYKAWGRRLFQPYIIAGLGRGTVERAYGGEDRLRYYEAGGGLLLRGRHLAIGIDIRKGVSHVDADAPMATSTARISTPTPTEDRDDYVRGRVLAMFAF